MSYKDLIKTGKTKAIVNESAQGSFKFTKENPIIIGKLIRLESYRKNMFDKKSVIYVVDTDIGTQQFFLGRATDNILRDKLIPGEIYEFTYLGKKKTRKGREMNNFKIIHIVDYDKELLKKTPKTKKFRKPRKIKTKNMSLPVSEQDKK